VAKKAVVERLRLRENFDRLNFAIHKEKEMADFRRWILAFAALVLVLGFVAPASAQNGISCTASASVTPTLRHEGFTELTGDIVLNCVPQVGASPTQSPNIIPQATVTVSLSAPVTSRLIGTLGLNEALLLVDDPVPANQDVCMSPFLPTVACEVVGDNGQTFNQSVASGGHAKYNVFQGISGGPGSASVTFLGVPVDPPTTSRRFRITNIRIDATSVPSGVAGLSPVFAFVSASPSQSIQINTPQNYVGFVSNGLTASTSKPTNWLQCLAQSDVTVGTVTFTEDFSTAFKAKGATGQNTPGQVYYTESGLEVLANNATETGVADHATRLQTVLTGLPTGVKIYADTWVLSSASTFPYSLANVSQPGYSDATMVSPVAGTEGTAAQALVYDGTASGATGTVTLVWETTYTNPSAIDVDAFNIYATYKAFAAQAPDTAYALSGFNPQLAAYSSSGPIPEFSSTVNVPTAPSALFNISLCQTVLLFPYVTDFYGFDTGIAISNTGLDPLPSSLTAVGETGTCTVTFFGDDAIATTLGTNGAYTSPKALSPGETWAFSMSTIDPGYNSTPTYGTTGYAIGVCNFQYAHGYSFVSDTGIRQFAAAYLALIIPDAPRSPQPFICSSVAICNTSEPGEQLVH